MTPVIPSETTNNSEQISGSLDDSKLSSGNLGQQRENTRSVIARRYVYSFLFIIAWIVAAGILLQYSVEDTGKFLVSISSVMSGPLGFIIGFYFKTGDEK